MFDRYWCTTRAYARAAGSPLDLDEVEALLPRADVTLLVDLPEEERRRRLELRGTTELDLASVRHAAALRRELYAALDRPVAGHARVLDVRHLDPDAAVRAACEAIVTSPTLFQRLAS